MILAKTTASNNLGPLGHRHRVCAWTGFPLAFNQNLDIFPRWKGASQPFTLTRAYTIVTKSRPLENLSLPFSERGASQSFTLTGANTIVTKFQPPQNLSLPFHRRGIENDRVIPRASFAEKWRPESRSVPIPRPENERNGVPQD